MDFKKLLSWSALPSLLLYILVIIINGIISIEFLSLSSWVGFLQTTVPVIVLSVGQAVVILGGGIDLSIGATLSLVNVIMATTSGFEGSVFPPIILGFIVAMGIGLLNGFLTSTLRINSLLATFSVSFISSGIAMTILPIPGGAVPSILSDFYYHTIFGIIPTSVIFVVVAYFTYYLWSLTPSGIYLYSQGNDIYKAFFSGINVEKNQFKTYIFSAFCAYLAGFAASCNFCAGDPRLGNTMTLSSVAACVIGGLSMSGGSGNVIGSIFGALFLNIILNTVLGLGIPTYFQELVSGAIVVLGIFLAILLSSKRKESMKSQ
jgi:ribose transport system permease protein